MKKYLVNTIILQLVIFLVACQGKNLNAKKSVSSVEQDGKKVKFITSKNDSVSFELKYAGDIELNDDETGIKSISSKGYLKYRKNDQKLTAESNSQGQIAYKLEDGHKELSLDDNGKKFIAASIKEIVAYGFDLENRLNDFYANGGSQAVLGEVENMKTDDVRATYFEYLLSKATLQQEELAEVARKIQLYLNTDIERRKLLSRYAADFLKIPPAVQPYFEAVRSINADYEKANVLRDAIRQPLSNQAFSQLLAITGTLQSDNEKASVLGNLIKTDIKTEEQWVNLLNTAAQVSSTAEKTILMLQIAGKMPKKGEAETAYLEVAKTITARAEYSRVTKAIQ